MMDLLIWKNTDTKRCRLLGFMRAGGMLVLLWQCCWLPSWAAERVPPEEQYQFALQLIQNQQYQEALGLLRQLQKDHSDFPHLNAVQTRIAVLHESAQAGNALIHYLSALDKRDSGDKEGALSSLNLILSSYPKTSLRDDTLYLKAYIQVMERYEFAAARLTLEQLRSEFGESAYQDSADYLDAIALEQLGETEQAVAALQQLRKRHTALSLPFDFLWPAGNVLSRYWFERADQRLAMLDTQQNSAAKLLRSRSNSNGDALVVNVSVDGVELTLNLTPSPLTKNTKWVDGNLADTTPPAAAVYSGTVEGDEASWVRAVVIGDGIIGSVYAFGQQHTLKPGTLLGTLDYYQPRSAANRLASIADSTSTEAHLEVDGLEPPPEANAAQITRRAVTDYGDMRVVPVSLVIDSEFNRYYAGQGLATALNSLNMADGIYRQFGIVLTVDEVQIFQEGDDDPMLEAPATLEAYLNSFRAYRRSRNTFFSGSALTFLFTGKERTDTTLGLAWIDTLCRTDGYDVGVTTPSSIGGVLLTHEIGHSLGARHDSETSCNQDTTKLMWPYISTRTDALFSDCSKSSVAAARVKSCLRDAVDLAISAEGDLSSVHVELSNLDTSLSPDATLTIETSVPGLLQWPAGCYAVSATSGQCDISRLAAGESRSIELGVQEEAQTAANPAVTGYITPVDMIDYSPSNNRISYALDTQTVIGIPIDNATGGALGNTVEVSAASGGSGRLGVGFLWGLGLLFIARWVFPVRFSG